MLISCDTTITNIVNSMFKEFPSVTEKMLFKLSANYGIYKTEDLFIVSDGKWENKKFAKFSRQLSSICTINMSIHGFRKICGGIKEIIPGISDMHLFIDVFYWEGMYIVQQNR